MGKVRKIMLLSFLILFFNLTLLSQSYEWNSSFFEVNYFRHEFTLSQSGATHDSTSKNIFFPKYKYKQAGEDDSKKKIPGYLHLLLGAGWANATPSFLDPESNSELGGLSLQIAAGAQINQYIGVGFGVNRISTFDPYNSHLSFTGTGVNLNGYPGLFFYNVTIGIVNRYELIDDKEYRSKTFEKEKGNPFFFDIKGGLKIGERIILGMGYFSSSKIKGIYKEYEVPWTSNISIFDEGRKSQIAGFQFFVGFKLIKHD